MTTKKQISDELLRRGSFRHLLKGKQREFYDLVKSGKSDHYGLYSARKCGKSWTLFTLALEHCYSQKGRIARIILPEKVQAREIYFNLYNEFKDHLPADVMPIMMKSESAFVFPNGSRIVLGGSTPDNCESSRGPICTMLLCDEIASFDADNYDYLMYSILLPQGTTVKDFVRVDATTPPRSPAHPWIQKDYQKLNVVDNLIKFTIFENVLVDDRQRAKIIDQYGGEDNKNFRREHMLELISDNDSLVVPEFDSERHVVAELDFSNGIDPEDDNKQFQFASFMALDVGYVDGSGFVAGYYNHYLNKLFVTDEHYEVGMTTRKLADKWREFEDTFRDQPLRYLEPVGVMDVMEQEAGNLRREEGISFRRPRKGRVEDTIGFLRTLFETDRIAIHEDCKVLRMQLENATWSTSATENKKIERNEMVGHADCLVALSYLVKEVQWGKRPGKGTLNESLQFSGGKSR